MINVGDLVSLTLSGNVKTYGEVVGVLDDKIEVYLLVKGVNNVWHYSSEWHLVPTSTITQHVVTSKCANIVVAFKQLGFRPLTEDTFARLDESGEVPVGDACFDVEADDFPGIHPEMQDFIIPDEEGEAFTFAEPSNEFVIETHKAVREFNDWNPSGDAKKLKNFVLSMENRVIKKESSRTRLGEAVSYNKPPI
jgi:hypothetical protein